MTKGLIEGSSPTPKSATRWHHFLRTHRTLLRLVMVVAALLVVGDAFVNQRSLGHILVGHTAAILLLAIVAAMIEWQVSE